MGFTIGGMREIRERRLLPRRARWQHRGRPATAVAEYTGLWGWEVRPGNRIMAGGSAGAALCSCGDTGCRRPGDHPVSGAGSVASGSTLDQAAAAWEQAPDASVLLPTGLTFDVLEVPAAAGEQALLRLERLGLPLGPVAATPHGRAWFLTEPGTAVRLDRSLYGLGWDRAGLPLRGLGPGRHITAPPSECGLLGPVRWLRPPDLESSAGVPAGRMLLSTLAYACHRVAHP